MVLFMVCLLLSMSLPHAMARENSQSLQQTILIMGDSISASYGIKQEQGWVHLLTTRLDPLTPVYSVVNASISGETSRGGANRIGALLKQHAPNTVIIELGGNDGLRGSPIPVISKNLEAMITQSKQAGANVLLLGMRIPPNYGETYSNLFAQQYQDLALKHELSIVPFLLEGIATEPGMMQADGIHPTAQAQPIMMEHVWRLLQSASVIKD